MAAGRAAAAAPAAGRRASAAVEIHAWREGAEDRKLGAGGWASGGYQGGESMLILSRHLDERLIIDGGRIIVTVIQILPDRVRLGVTAPPDCRIDREEIHERRRADREAGAAGDGDGLSLP